MAARRVTASSINWTAMAERVPEKQRPNFLAFKAKTDSYLRRVNANPAEAPKLDFSSYKSKIPIAGLVESFQKQYESYKVPYPSENLTAKIAEQEKQAAAEIKEFIAHSNQRIQAHEATLAKWAAALPYEDMTLEEYCEAHPDVAWNPEKPTFWPHNPEEQLDYVEPEIGAAPKEDKK